MPLMLAALCAQPLACSRLHGARWSILVQGGTVQRVAQCRMAQCRVQCGTVWHCAGCAKV
eukprot:scaffold74687_cov23-Tisochrysis_lutea.AAC.1